MSAVDLSKWQARYQAASHTSAQPSPFLLVQKATLPAAGRALDVAGGAGRNALWLAQQGYDVTIADISQAGLHIASERARRLGLSVHTQQVDFDDGFPVGPWDVVTCFMYSPAQVFPHIMAQLAPGGSVVALQPTLTNLERHARPPQRFLLEAGALLSLAAGLEMVHYEESWSTDGFHEARLHAKRLK